MSIFLKLKIKGSIILIAALPTIAKFYDVKSSKSTEKSETTVGVIAQHN